MDNTIQSLVDKIYKISEIINETSAIYLVYITKDCDKVIMLELSKKSGRFLSEEVFLKNETDLKEAISYLNKYK